MYKGLTGVLTLEGLPHLEEQFATSRLLARFRERPTKIALKTNLFRNLLETYWWMWLAPFPTRIVQAAFEFTQPFLITRTLYWLYMPTPDSTAVGYGLLGAFAIVYIGIAVSRQDEDGKGLPYPDRVGRYRQPSDSTSPSV